VFSLAAAVILAAKEIKPSIIFENISLRTAHERRSPPRALPNMSGFSGFPAS
jgi:hypothetical protein